MSHVSNTAGDKQNQLAGPPQPRVWRKVAKAAGRALVLALAPLIVAALAATAANATTGYTANNGEMEVYVTCQTNTYHNGTPNYIATSAKASIEPGYATQRIGLVLWFYRMESGTWYSQDLGWGVDNASVAFSKDWIPPLHGHYYVVGRFYYGRVNAPSVATDLPVDWYANYWDGLPQPYTKGSCQV